LETDKNRTKITKNRTKITKKTIFILIITIFCSCQKNELKTIILSKSSENYVKWMENDNTIILDAYTIKNTDSIL